MMQDKVLSAKVWQPDMIFQEVLLYYMILSWNHFSQCRASIYPQSWPYPSSKSNPLTAPPDLAQPDYSSSPHQNALSSYGSYNAKGSSTKTTESGTSTLTPRRSRTALWPS